MVINLKAIFDSTDMSQADFAKITGISRYSVWKATEPAYDGMFNVTPDRFYKIHCSLPDLIPLPDDFFHYTRPGFMINKYLNHYSKDETLSEVPRRLYEIKNYFFYNYKDGMDRLFPNMYLPYYKDEDNNLQFYKGEDFIPFNLKRYEKRPITLLTPVTWERYRSEFGEDRELYDRYSSDNIRANLFFRNLFRKDFLDILTTDLHLFMTQDVSFVQNGALLEKVFHPYITVLPYQNKNKGK